MSEIKLLVMDVDGTLTDGKIYMGQNGEAHKAFNIKDGAGISLLLPENNIIPVIITARKSRILENRCKELGIQELYQDCFKKLDKLKEIADKFGVGFDAIAYAGDDLPDIPCMEEIKDAGGRVLAPADAIPEIRAIADYVSGVKAGEGAIRDCINYLIRDRKESLLSDRIKKAIEFILSGEYDNKNQGIVSEGEKYTVQEYDTKPEDECVLESHRSHIDIQYMISGTELLLR